VDRQGIHIRPQSDRWAIAGPKHANHTGLADVAMSLAAELGKLTGEELERSMLLEAKFGVCVQILPPRGHVVVKQIDEMWDLHIDHLRHGCTNSRQL
jgi:hypothetical protein